MISVMNSLKYAALIKALRLKQSKFLCIHLISMCYDISTGLFDTNIRRFYMYDKPPHKSHTADSIIFKKEDDFRMTLVLAIGQLACGLMHEWLH